MKKLWVGTSGYSYSEWAHGVFYPKGLARKHWFDFYTTQFQAVELNSTFYRLPNPKTIQNWYQHSGSNFRFVVKGSRYLTHILRLKHSAASLTKFFNAIKPLKEKLALVLWQLPPGLKLEQKRLEKFLILLKKKSPTPAVFEFRDKSWFCPEIENLLKAFGAAFCQADQPSFYTNLKIPETAPFVYLRRHGPAIGSRYAKNYSDKEIRQDVRYIQGTLQKGKEVYIFFNNDIGGAAPKDANRLLEFMRE